MNTSKSIKTKRFKRVYVEITNVCNRDCSFCIKTTREKKYITTQMFEHVINEIAQYTDYIYLHVMGEPLLHGELGELIAIANARNIAVNITTNGVLIANVLPILLPLNIRKIAFSLHSYGGNNDDLLYDEYLHNILIAVDELKHNTICELRFWDGKDSEITERNSKMIGDIASHCGITVNEIIDNWVNGGCKIERNVYVGCEPQFEWPTLKENTIVCDKFCYGLREQIAILVDGTVVPCCLDSNGDIPLGNIYNSSMSDILRTRRAMAICEGFSNRRAVAELCKRCKYAEVKF